MELDNTVVVLMAVLAFLAPVFVYFRLKNTPLELEIASTDSGIDKDVLAQAEKDIEGVDPRDTYLNRNLALLENFYTTQGFSNSYMVHLINKLSEAGINADYYFYDNMPVGTIGAVRGGCYELYVDRDRVESAREMLHKHFQ